MDIDIDLLEKMPLRDVVYLCLRDERPEQYNGNANLPSSGAFVDESNITRDQCCGNYGLEHVRSGLRLCNKVDQSNSLEWTVFNRNNSFVAVTVWYPEYCDDESDGHIEFMSEELDRAGMEKFVMEQLLSLIHI